MTTHVSQAVKDAAINEVESSVEKIVHCAEQLTDEQLWWRPAPEMNSIANLILHLCGNVRQWIIAGVGGAADTRDRPKEFAERGPIDKATLLDRLRETIDQAKDAISGASDETFVAPRQIQAFDTTGVGAIFHSIAHFQGHAQEIIHLARIQLGDDYRFSFVPTREQGA